MDRLDYWPAQSEDAEVARSNREITKWCVTIITYFL